MSKKKKTLEELLEEALVPKEEQPCDIPENWIWTKLGIISEWGSGGTPKSTNKEYYDGDIPWLIISDLNDGIVSHSEKKITELGLKNSSAKLIPKDTLLVAMYGSIGKLGITDMSCTTNQAIAFAKEPKVNIKFLFYYLLCIREKLKSLGKGGTQQNISQTVLKEVPIPIPLIKEQQKIVSKIEILFAKIDEAKGLIKESITSSELRRESLETKYFNLNDSQSMKIYKFSEVCLKITDGTHKSPKSFGTGDFMYVTAKNIKKDGIQLDNITYVSQKDHTEIYSRCDVKKGDVLYIKDGATTGIATINTLDEEFSLLSSVAVLRVDERLLLPEYLKYYLNAKSVKRMMLDMVSGNAITRLTLKKIKDAEIVLPSIEEQKKIVDQLQRIYAIEKNIQVQLDLIKKLDVIKQTILSKAFKGELGTNDPVDEPAIELLKSILQEKL